MAKFGVFDSGGLKGISFPTVILILIPNLAGIKGIFNDLNPDGMLKDLSARHYLFSGFLFLFFHVSFLVASFLRVLSFVGDCKIRTQERI